MSAQPFVHFRLCLNRAFGWRMHPAKLESVFWLDCFGPDEVRASGLWRDHAELSPLELSWERVLELHSCLVATGALESGRPQIEAHVDTSDVYYESTVYGSVSPRLVEPTPFHFTWQEMATGVEGPDAPAVKALLDCVAQTLGVGRL